MDTGRPDLNSMIKVTSIAENEPTFLLRPQDSNAGDAVRAWVAFSAMAGVAPAVLEQALQQADRMDAWPTKKLPGDDHLDDGERKQLEFQHQRRLWKAEPHIPWRLAEARDHGLHDPAALLGQLAREQQVIAERLFKIAEIYWHELEAGPPSPMTPPQEARWREVRRRAADEQANRAAYFLSVATALRLGQVALANTKEEAA